MNEPAVAMQVSPRKQNRKLPGFRPTFPLPLKLKVRSLYIIQQLPAAEIAAQVGLTSKQIQDLVKREGWIEIRRRAKAGILAKHDARAREEISEIHDAFALKTEELGMGVLEKAAKRLPDEDENACRDLQALSQTAKNFIGIARQVRGMDLDANKSGGSGSVVVFVGELDRVSAARPVHEVSASAVPALPAAGQPVTG